MSQGVSTTELIQDELGKNFVEAKQRADRKNMSYRENEIGEKIIVAYNPYTLKNQRNDSGQLKYPYAEAVFNAFNKMLKDTIPENAILSAKFQSWINRERNELMIDSKINKDDYFKMQTDFETGEIEINRGNALIQAKMDFLNKNLERISKAFKTHMEKNSQEAFANEETLQKFAEYYKDKAQKVVKILESGDFSAYDRKDKEGNIAQKGTQEDALQHQNNIGNALEKIEKAQAEQSARVSQSEQSQKSSEVDYVGDTLENKEKHQNRYR